MAQVVQETLVLVVRLDLEVQETLVQEILVLEVQEILVRVVQET